MTGASLILVNYNTTAHALRAVAALHAQGLPVEIIVVDNGSRPEERRQLEALPRDVQVVRNEENLGYGGAINRALPLARAAVLGFLNPDIVPFPGALKTLCEVLEGDSRIGVAGPRTWWDEARTFLLPPVPLPSLTEFMARWLGHLHPGLGLAHSRRLARRVRQVGFGGRLTCLRMLAGAFLLTRRSVIQKVGGFDRGFPLYFEDADWCRRVRKAGYRIAYVPSAEIVHYFDQSARQISSQAEVWRNESWAYYLRKYYGRLGKSLCQWLEATGTGVSRRLHPALPVPMDNLGPLGAPPVLPLSGPDTVIQVAYHWYFFEAAMGIVSGRSFQFPPAIWEHLRPARYFARALDPRTLRPLRTWTWEKR